MNKAMLAILCTGLALPAYAQKKDCEALKGEIEAKLKAKGVAKYTLEIVAKDAAAQGKEVGTCDGATKKIVYKRG